VTDVDLSVWQRTMSLDLLGPMLCCRHGIPEIIKAGGGTVVNMSSGAALRGGSHAHIYTAAKGHLSLTRALAGAYAKDNVRVNAICAGRILTERITSNYGTPAQPGPIADRQDAAGRSKEYPFWVGKPEDIANIALFLASDESRMITGATIPAVGAGAQRTNDIFNLHRKAHGPTPCMYHLDFDAMSGFIARGMTSPTPISRGEFGADVATARILELLKKYKIPTSWYIPGHTLETYPERCKQVIRRRSRDWPPWVDGTCRLRCLRARKRRQGWSARMSKSRS
jgi:hypothetical protein